ncbi:MAG: hypothetical protein HY788_10845 [Deltaproteobacteria bacterium]|nr:hypothetical protein [Deltaproteobacteria bacterium]
MKYRHLIYLALFFGALFIFLCWLLEASPRNIGERLVQLKEMMETRPDILLYVTVVYAVCLSIPYVPGGIGLLLVIFAGFTGVLYFMAGTFVSMGVNFLVGRRYPIVMKIFKKLLEKRLAKKDWWPKGESVSIFHIIQHYLEEDRFGTKINRLIFKLPFKIRLSEKTIIFLLLILPINVVVGGGGGAALVCGEESSLPLLEFMKVVFWAHLLYVCIPFAIYFFVP